MQHLINVIKKKNCVVGERAKRARHYQVCSIENRGYILLLLLYIMVCANFVLIIRKEGGA